MAITKFKGIVGKGNGDGRKLGIPTANISTQEDLTGLKHGVYAVKVMLDGTILNGVAHYGPRAVFGEKKPLFEVHILDFDRDIYGMELVIELGKFIRKTVKFKTVEEMMEQIEQDIREVRNSGGACETILELFYQLYTLLKSLNALAI